MGREEALRPEPFQTLFSVVVLSVKTHKTFSSRSLITDQLLIFSLHMKTGVCMKLMLGDTGAIVVSGDWVKYRDFAYCIEDCPLLLISCVRRWWDSCRDFGMGKKKKVRFFKIMCIK